MSPAVGSAYSRNTDFITRGRGQAVLCPAWQSPLDHKREAHGPALGSGRCQVAAGGPLWFMAKGHGQWVLQEGRAVRPCGLVGQGQKQVTGELGREVKRPRRQAIRNESRGYLRNGMNKGVDIGKPKSF